MLSSVLGLTILACASPSKNSSDIVHASSASPIPPARVETDGIVATLSAGDAVNGGVVTAQVEAPRTGGKRKTLSVIGEYEGQTFELYPAGPGRYEAPFGVPFQKSPGTSTLVVRVTDGKLERRLELPLVVREGDYASEQLSADPKFINPPKKDLVRIQREAKEVGALYRKITRTKHWKGPFTLPIDSAITSRYGNKRLFNGQMQSYHQGLDLRAQVGTPIRAPAPGRVVLSKDLFFTGKTVILDHGYGVFTVYAHMSKFRVRRGERVKNSQVLGLSGMTGRASGPHLHWGAIIHRTKVDPIFLTQVMK